MQISGGIFWSEAQIFSYMFEFIPLSWFLQSHYTAVSPHFLGDSALSSKFHGLTKKEMYNEIISATSYKRPVAINACTSSSFASSHRATCLIIYLIVQKWRITCDAPSFGSNPYTIAIKNLPSSPNI